MLLSSDEIAKRTQPPITAQPGEAHERILNHAETARVR